MFFCSRIQNLFVFLIYFQDQKRQQIVQAAEKRAKENESKGIKNPEKVKRMQELSRQRELQEAAAGSNSEGGLKWQVG